MGIVKVAENWRREEKGKKFYRNYGNRVAKN